MVDPLEGVRGWEFDCHSARMVAEEALDGLVQLDEVRRAGKGRSV